MTETRIKISSIVDNQLPQFVREEFPLVSEFLSQYYTSLENQGGTSDILQNIDQYIKVDNLTNLIDSTNLSSDVTFFDSTINVISTAGFPDSYGLLLIDSEIITYTSKTSTSFEGCVRGFSGITSYEVKDELIFSESESEDHSSGSIVTNLSILFLKEFLNKVKKQITPGFENRELYSELNERLFIKQSIDFYSSKGTDSSFKILFAALYGQNVEIIRPRDYLIQPSDAQYRITLDLVVEAIEGNPEDLVNATLYQDKTDFIDAAQGTITKVEKIRRDNKNYYVISLDSGYDKDIESIGSVYGKFTIHPKTKVTSTILSGSNTIEVDSTVAFPNRNGNLIVDLENGTTLNLTYTSKTLNQFLGCFGITQDIPKSSEIKFDSFASSKDKNIKVRILGVLSEFKIPERTRFYSKGDLIKIKTLGIDSKDTKSNNWFFNIPVKYDVQSILIEDFPNDSNSSSSVLYRINTYDDNFLRIGDYVTLISSSGGEKFGYISSIINKKSFSINFGSRKEFGSQLNINSIYTIEKNISKVLIKDYPSVEQYTANVQNVYLDNEGSLYVAAPSLPNYLNRNIKINDQSVTFSGTFSGTTLNIGIHGFYTGDSIVYKPSPNNNLGISTGVYFIKKVSDTEIKLSRSKDNIFYEKFITVNGTVTNAKFELVEFTYRDLSTQLLDSQKLIRKISLPEVDGKIYETEPGLTGIFVNGIELLNYKSKDNVYYGPIQEIIPTAPGSDYDVINPPILTISDPIGSGANAHCSVIGNLKRIEIIDPGFDYIEEPTIEITGGNGFGASAKANLVSFDHEVSFNSQSSSGLVKLNPINTIEFYNYHKFRNAEEIIYITDGQNGISGLTTNSSYFVSIQDAYTVKLHNSFSDAVSGINTISLTSYGIGNQSFRCKNKKKKIGSIAIENGGSNYQNKLTTTNVSGINTALDTINIKSHGYQSGEIITYNSTESSIGGLSSSTSYYVTKITDDSFKLSSLGIGTIGVSTSFYYDTKQYVDLTSLGSGIHKFNYPEIKVSVKGRIGVSTLTNQNFDAIIQPIFRGEIQSVSIENGGSKYGSQEIINYNRQPSFTLNSGSGIELTPIVSNGQIVDVIINKSGSNYNSIPNLEVVGDGTGAILTPIILNGSLIEVKIIYGGIDYTQDSTSIIATSSGTGSKFECNIKSWKIDLVKRLIYNSKLFEDEGILTKGLNSDYGLEYSHAYASRSLRASVQATSFRDGNQVYIPDLENDIEENPSHSPIIGWAYDGNPIYGPYGYSSKTGGSVKSLVSSYKRIITPDRPGGSGESLYPWGFFVDDYEYVGDGDLDEHNGRFGVTPEYPNGVYAYFATLEQSDKTPSFPYIIGPSYKSKPIDFNFRTDSNQDFIDINMTGWKRNTTPYGLLNEKTYYEFLTDSNKIKPQISIVKNVLKGTVDSIGIVTGGKDYEVGDQIIFNSENQLITGAKSSVSLVKGKLISQINAEISSFNDVILYPSGRTGKFIGFTTTPHNYKNNDLVTFTGKFDYKKSSTINVNSNILTLISGVGSTQYTGIVTYFNVSGNLNYPYIRENDVYQIGNEQIKILNVEPNLSRIRVLRNQNGIVGLTSYSVGTEIIEKPKRFSINLGISTTYNFNINKELYFNPIESVGLGTSFGVGIVSTIYFSNPGFGITQISIPTQSIYLPNHNLSTGDSLIYSSNGGTGISVSTDRNYTFELQNNSLLYVAKISNDLIGISTVKVGLGSTGSFNNLDSTEGGILYFTSVGVGDTHSFKTNYENTLVGSISKNTVTVSTAETHGLSVSDSVIINVNVGISTTFVVKYDDYNRRILINSRTFSSIDISNNIITINDHNYYTGQKIVYTSNTPAIGLTNNNFYYVIVVDENTFRLSNSYYGATKNDPEIIDILSSTSGTISPINPPLQIIKNQQITFDLSDSSLSFISNARSYSAFEFKLYTDNKFTQVFDTTQTSNRFEVSQVGRVGIDSTAKLSILINDQIPNNLYYNLVPINLDLNSQVKQEIVNDNEVISSNQISIVESEYNGRHTIVGVGSTYFQFNILEKPKFQTLTSNSNNLEYFTDTLGIKGEIQEIVISNKGNYDSLPVVNSIISKSGSESVIVPISDSIGRVSSTEIQDIGFEYSADYSVRPIAKFPDILRLNPLSTFDRIGITSFGKNYTIAPDLIVIDGLTNKVIEDVNLLYSIGDKTVTIRKNTYELSDVTPKIIPINNPNGIKIKNIVFDNITKDVTVTLGASFSDPEDYPFFIGSNVLIEGVSVGVGSTGRGYNSSNYNYTLFTLTGIDPNIGGAIGVVTFNMSSYLREDEIPGTFNSFNSSGRIVPESYFPIFNPILKKNNFYKGEIVYSATATGNVENWDPNQQYLKVSTIDEFDINQTVRGKTSGSVGIINEIIGFESDYKVNSYSQIRKGWNRETGFLNNDFQRVHDNDYYQYFSYELKSKIDLNTWDNSVSALNHTAGFKKFGNLIIESTQLNGGISTDQNQGDFTGISDLSSFVSLNCVYDFDLVRENNLYIDQDIKSDEIIFNSAIIQDYIESIGNRVLMIDNISDQFNSNPRPTDFSVVDSFKLNEFRSKKYISFVMDKRFTNECELGLISLIHDNSFGFLNQYGSISPFNTLGFFDFNISGTDGNLLYYPVKSKYDNYHIELFSFSLNDISSGIGTVNLGDSVCINTNTNIIPQGTISPIGVVGIASTYRSAKVLVQIGATDSSYFEYDEITYIHDNNNVYFIDYGQLSTDNFGYNSSSGIGTYDAYLSGSNVQIDLIPNFETSVDYVINTFNVSLGNSSVSGIGTEIIEGSSINSSSVSIASSSFPVSNVIATYSTLSISSKNYNSSYSIISIEDKTNLNYQVSEFLTVLSDSNCYTTEFGIVQTGSSLGIITAGLSGLDVNIYFTPIENIDVDVKVFKVDVGLDPDSGEISLLNGSLNYDYGSYTGSYNDVKKEFNLTHKNIPIFQRNFDGSNSNIVNIENNTISIENHFYITGEEIEYSYPGVGTTQAIGIATTSIAGIGITDKLPSSLFVVKVNDIGIQVAASASEALKTIPNTLDLTSVGIGSVHTFTSKNQNNKVIIGIDNVIQSPVVSTSITSFLTKNVTPLDFDIYCSDISSIFSGDLIKIGDEIMKVSAVGVGSTNSILVIRSWLGTEELSHNQYDIVTKVFGTYSISNNTLYFSEAPFGKIPFTNFSNNPSEQDYIGISTSSTFSGRVFLRSGISDTTNEPYSNNYIFDDISDQFNGFENTFTLKSNNSNVTGISTDNAILLINSIFQGPVSTNIDGDYNLIENTGITSITFTGVANSTSYDVNTGSLPRGGIILSLGSTQGFGYQPLISAGGTAIVSYAGTIQSISIGNSGSGYRSGIQKIINVGVKTENLESSTIEFVGVASVINGNIVSIAITNPGVGYTSSNPPIVVFDSPLSYSNLPLIYSPQSSVGLGTGAVIDIVVGQGSSVISFELKNLGYGYKRGEILTVSIGGTLGIQTTYSSNFSEFQIIIDNIQSDQFTAWSIGNLQVIDPLDSLFDGNRKVFPILIEGNQTTIRSKKGSNIDVQASLLVFINDVLQVPGQGYIFAGGSRIEFTEAPKIGDKSKIIFYKGTGDIDTQVIDILETIKVGDNVQIKSDDIILNQNDRLVTEIISSDIIETNIYSGPGISQNENLLRPILWCKQTEDLFVNGQSVGKNRIIYESYIQPVSSIIQNVGIGSTIIFVENVKSLFDNEREYIHDGTIEKPQNKILIVSQDNIVSAAATAVVSISGTISSIIISDGGVGYSTSPTVSIGNPVGIATTGLAQLNATIINGSVTSVSVIDGGFGYDSSQPPMVLIEPPEPKYEVIDNISYTGDFGVITGIKTTSVGVASTGIVFDFFIPQNSPLRDGKTVTVGIATTGISGIQTGYYFTINNSNVGQGLTSLNSSGGVVGVGTTFIDNIYQVAAVSIAQTAVSGVGVTYVAQVTVSVSNYNGLSGIGYSGFYGEYSWGRISTPTRKNPQQFTSYANIGGISTSPTIQRFNRLKFSNYNT
jgi:hypothetical protein